MSSCRRRRSRTGFTWDENKAYAAARDRLESVLGHIRTMGAEASGEVGHKDPVEAARDAMRSHPVDEVILSTLPSGHLALARPGRSDAPEGRDRRPGRRRDRREGARHGRADADGLRPVEFHGLQDRVRLRDQAVVGGPVERVDDDQDDRRPSRRGRPSAASRTRRRPSPSPRWGPGHPRGRRRSRRDSRAGSSR